MRVNFLFALLLAFVFVHGQSKTTSFDAFAEKQFPKFMNAYESRDIQAYNKAMKEFLVEYNKLTPEVKKKWSDYVNGIYYNQSCIYSLAGNNKEALVSLRNAVDAGYMGYSHMLVDSDLLNIRNEKEFAEITNKLRPIADYKYILKKAEKYDLSDQRAFPSFTYQASGNENLATLKKEFNLDSIAGVGTDVYRIINLMHWIHFLVPHDGNHENPTVKNALNMINECKKSNRGLNCRGLATVLNECYLSLGYKSRIVTCLPKDSLKIDNDCHVINLVYSESLRKWLWMDPTNDAYVMNEHGELLSIEEVRERLVTDKPLYINPDANWNRSSISKADYLDNYMAKNLYILECPLNSEYNMETRVSGESYTYIRLLPLEYYNQGTAKYESRNEKSNTTFIYFNTNNPSRFWQAPDKKGNR